MKYEKLDAALAASLATSRDARHPVFVSFRSPLNREAERLFSNLGIAVKPNDRIISGVVSASAIADLSELGCVRSIKLSGSSRLARKGAP